MYMTVCRKKFRVLCLADWNHHRHGWSAVASHLVEKFHCDFGVDLYASGVFAHFNQMNQFIDRPWCAFMHVTPSDPGMVELLTKNEMWLRSLDFCRGIYVLTEYGRDFLLPFMPCQVEVLPYILPPMTTRFCPSEYVANENKKIYAVGHWHRRYDFFHKMPCSHHEKIMLNCMNNHDLGDVKTLPYLDGESYDSIFVRDILFLDFVDSSASTTLMECIASSTPVLVNRQKGVEEYIGSGYPLFFDRDDFQADLLHSDRVLKAHEYLCRIDKSRFGVDSFLQKIMNGDIYQSLPACMFD